MKTKGIISSREQRKQFDQAVKEVVKQRKAANRTQNAQRNQARRGPTVGNTSGSQQQSPITQSSHGNRSERRHPSIHLATSLTATNNSIVINPEGLLRLREEHPHRPRSGSNANPVGEGPLPRRSSYDVLSIPRFSQGNRRRTDADDPASLAKRQLTRRSSSNQLLSSTSSLNSGDETTTKTAQRQQHQNTMRRVMTETSTLVSLGTNGQGTRSENETCNSRIRRNVSTGDTMFVVPAYRPKDTGSITSSLPINNLQDVGRKASHRRLISRDITSSGSEFVDSDIVNGLGGIKEGTGRRGSQQNLTQMTNLNLEDIANGIGDIKLQDLVPTQRRAVSTRENREKIAQENEMDDGEEGNGSEKVKEKEKKEASSVSSSPSKDMIGQWKNQELMMHPAQLAFGLGLSESDRGVDDLCFMEKSYEKGQPKGMGERIPSYSSLKSADGRRPSGVGEGMSSFTSYKTDSDAPPLQQGFDIDGDVCPRRSQFGLLKYQEKSQSGATGRTQGTSASSLYSLDGSVTAANSASSRAIIGNFEAIKEEVKELGDSIETSVPRELASGDNSEVHTDNFPGFPTYKSRQTSRIKKIRESIRKSMMGTNEGGDGDAMSRRGSAISTDQQQRLSRHLQRKASSRSVTSAYTSFSGVMGKSDAASSDRWSRFRRNGKTKSMLNIDTNSNSGRGRGQILATKGQFSSNISNVSSQSNASFQSSDSSFTAKCTNFYDHSDHARAISSLVLSKASSGRSLVTSLATVKEPAHEGSGGRGEQKRDEDYSSSLGSIDAEPSAYHVFMEKSDLTDDSVSSFYRHPSHLHTLVHMSPSQVFPDSPGWQCDECLMETFDSSIWAYISTDKNYVLCGRCFSKTGFSVGG